MPVYPSNFESKLGFDTIRQLLIEKCQSSMGRKEVAVMDFSSSFHRVSKLLRQTSEMKGIYERGDDLPEVAFNELDRWLPSLKIEGTYASPEEFLQLKNSLVSFEQARRYFTKIHGAESAEGEGAKVFPYLAELFEGLEEYPDLTRAIERIIDKSGIVKDSASPELADVRSRLSGMQGSIAKAIQRIYASAVKEGFADKESAPTFRDGRMVIPVPAANKRAINGIIHDESATGKTVFIEPAETVELSNRMRELQLEEQRIVVRILSELTDLIRPFIDSILGCNVILGKMDFIMAKARFAIETGGEMPNLAQRPEIDWYGAVHPVLLLNLRQQRREIVPLNIRLEGKTRILLISGPNAGGKSVALKTVGIVQYMCQCGLLPTLFSNSHIGIFEKIFIDIGDEQSIENDLSTYSSHLRNMRYFMLHADKKTLILIDEIGSGTEPNIGSSLSKAILAELFNSKCYGVVTTHYHNLKRFAEETPGFINGAMLYDRQKLLPTFQLSIGNAGSSFALEIAGKIGLPKKVIDMAKEEVGEEYVESDRFLMEIARDRKYWQSKRQNIKERESRLEVLEQKYEKLISDLNQKRKEIIREAQEEAKQLLSGANKKIENTISEIKKAEAEKERTKQIRKDLEAFKEDVENADKQKSELKPSPNLPIRKKKEKSTPNGQSHSGQGPLQKQNKELNAGDYVKMTGSNATGQILSVSGKEAEVAFGNLRTKVNLSKLSPSSRPVTSGISSGYSLLNGGSSEESRRRQLEFRDELDVRGMRADEALERVTHFIDDARQFSIGKVRILHGTGAGILRQLIRQQLEVTPGVSKFGDEDVRLGGSGITVVTL